MATLTAAEQGGRILCDFDKKLFKKLHDFALLEEDDRLEELTIGNFLNLCLPLFVFGSPKKDHFGGGRNLG